MLTSLYLDSLGQVGERTITLIDEDGKELGRGSGYKVADLQQLGDGDQISVGGKEIEISGVIDQAEWESKVKVFLFHEKASVRFQYLSFSRCCRDGANLMKLKKNRGRVRRERKTKTLNLNRSLLLRPSSLKQSSTKRSSVLSRSRGGLEGNCLYPPAV